MIVWLTLFLIVIGISFILAYQSMKNYLEVPQKSTAGYGLFLVRQTQSFTLGFLESIHEFLLKEGLIVSLERLFKGGKSALTIFGPKKILNNYMSQLDLLELEDYAEGIDSKDYFAWEVGLKEGDSHIQNIGSLFGDLPPLVGGEQFWCQMTLLPKQGKSRGRLFQSQIRAVIFSKEPTKRKELKEALQTLGGFSRVPRPFSNDQILTFYQQRAMGHDSRGPLLTGQEIVQLLKV